MEQKTHEKYMWRCIELASKALGNTYPNPMVGSVIVHNNKIIGEGYHLKSGKPHAEVNAINSVRNKDLLKESTIYVNLEPCSHHGKTPPCSDLIIEKKIPDVVIGCVDSFSEVSGRGIDKLRKSGCNVTVDILEKESRELNKRFFTYHEKKRPFIILKWAQTLDGYIDAIRKKHTPIAPLWITNEHCRVLVHKWRTEEQAIMVGTKTANKDNPKLNVRDWYGNNPVRVVIDKSLSLSPTLSLFDRSVKTIVFTHINKQNVPNIDFVQLDFSKKNLLPDMLNVLNEYELQSVIIEGGTQLLSTFVQNNLWDEARVFVGNKNFCGGTKAPDFPFHFHNQERIGNSLLNIHRNTFDRTSN